MNQRRGFKAGLEERGKLEEEREAMVRDLYFQ